MKDVLLAVTQCKSSFSALAMQLGRLKEDINIIHHNLRRVTEKTKAVEDSVSTVKDQVTETKKDCKRPHITTLQAKMDDLENRLHRNNRRIIGISEKLEGASPTEYFEAWLRKHLQS